MRHLYFMLLAATLVSVQGCAGVVASSSGDLRSQGTQVEDETIEKKAMTRIQEKYKDSVQITVTCYNRFVLITGDAPSEDAKTNIERIIYSIPNVKKTANEVSVGAVANASIRRADQSISREIISGLGRNKSLRPGSIKVTTERGEVYLLGLVTHREANVASEIASTANDVQKVIRVFEYID